MIKVLVIDDSALMRKLLGRVLADVTEFEVYFGRNGMEGLAQLATVNPDVITLDIHMPGMDGLACLDRIMIEHPRPVLMVSSLTRDGADVTLEALRLGAVDFVPKPEGPLSLHMEVFGPLFVAKVRAVAGAKLKASLRLRERVQHRFRRQRIGAATRSRFRRSARADRRGTDLSWWAPRRAAPRRWKRCWAHCRRRFRGPSSSPSTCRPVSPARSRSDSTASVQLASARLRAPRRLSPATPISGAGTRMSLFRRSPAISSHLLCRPIPGAPGIRAPTGWWRAPSRMFRPAS